MLWSCSLFSVYQEGGLGILTVNTDVILSSLALQHGWDSFTWVFTWALVPLERPLVATLLK